MGGDSLSITLTPSEPLWSITQRIADLLANAGPDAKVSLVLWPKGTLDDVRFTSESAVPASAIHVDVIARQPADPDWPPPPPEPVPAPAPTPVPAPPVITSMWTTREMNIRAKPLADTELADAAIVTKLPAGTPVGVIGSEIKGSNNWGQAVVGYVAQNLLSSTPPK